MKEILIEELKVLQLDVLEAIHEFCIENNIKYSLGCGSFLGMIRHKGYIPWDDDIDIYMLREEYEKLIKAFPTIYRKTYRIVSLERDVTWDRAYAKAYNNNTIFNEDGTSKFQLGVGIDIYPIDKVPNDVKAWNRYSQKRCLLQKIYMLKSIKYSKNRNFVKNLCVCIGHILLYPFSLRYLALKINIYAQKYNKEYSDFVFENVQGVLQKNRFRRSIFNEIILKPFEDRLFYGFKDYDEYLKNAYGDYMKFPPKEQQVSHHSYCAYWK